MSTIARTRSRVPSPTPDGSLPLHRITVAEYERIADAGALDETTRVELIDGYLVDKMPKEPGRSFSATAVHQGLTGRLSAGWLARKEEPVRIPEFDEPEPDVSVVRGANADYRTRYATPADVALLVEVSESSLTQDRGEKRATYARAGIAVYWIVNLVDRQVEVYTRPTKTGRYRSRRDYRPGQQGPVLIAGRALPPIAVDDLLP